MNETLCSNKNLCIVTSAIQTSENPVFNGLKRSAFTPQERFDQTLSTIESIRQYIPNSFVVLIDATPMPEEWRTRLASIVDIALDSVHLHYVSREAPYKAVAECLQVLHALEKVEMLGIQFSNIFKIQGRFQLTASFEYDALIAPQDKATFKPISADTSLYDPNKPGCYMFMYRVPYGMLCRYKDVLRRTLAHTALWEGGSLESILPYMFSEDERHFVSSLGVSGFVGFNKSYFIDFDWEAYLANNRDLLIHGIREPAQLMAHIKNFHFQEAYRKIASNKPRILMIAHCYNAGTYFYYDYLTRAKELKDVMIMYYSSRAQLDATDLSKVSVVHVNSTVSTNIDREYLIGFLQKAKRMGIPIYVNCHDFQWVFPGNPNPLMAHVRNIVVDPSQVPFLMALWTLAKEVYMPSPYVLEYYTHISREHPQLCQLFNNKTKIAANPDFEVIYSNTVIPAIEDDTINVAFVGSVFLPHKGSDYFLSLAQKIRFQHKGRKVAFHVFGDMSQCVMYYKDHPIYKQCIIHGRYHDPDLLSLLRSNKIHLALFIGDCGETYGYCMSKIITSGVAIMYRKVGSFKTRLDPSITNRFFPIDEFSHENQMMTVFMEALDFITENANTYSYREPPVEPVIDAGYANYIVDALQLQPSSSSQPITPPTKAHAAINRSQIL